MQTAYVRMHSPFSHLIFFSPFFAFPYFLVAFYCYCCGAFSIRTNWLNYFRIFSSQFDIVIYCSQYDEWLILTSDFRGEKSPVWR